MHSFNYAGAVLVAILALVAVGSPQVRELRLVAAWSQMEYEFPSDTVRNQTIASGEYVPGAGVLIDTDIDYDGQQAAPRVFVTVPRFVPGIPITFGTLTNQTGPGGPLISAYPNYTWNANQGNNCDGLTSVFRVAIDDCRRLWVLDSGKIGNTNVQNCPPQLIVFDLDTDAVILRYRFPVDQYKIGSSLFITPVVDVLDATPGTTTTCNNTRVYITDVTGFGLLVYDLAQNTSWRAQNKFLYPAPHAGTFTVAGESFDLMDGVFTLSLTPQSRGQSRMMQLPATEAEMDSEMLGRRHHQRPNRRPDKRPSKYPAATPATAAPPVVRGERLVYFHALASNFEVAVPLRLLDNATLWNESVESVREAFQEIGYRGIQSTAEAMDRNGNQFFGLIEPIGIGCWDSSQPYDRRTIRVVAQNEATLQFSSGLKVKRNRDGAGELWVASNRYQKVADRTLSSNEVNFRIQSVAMNQLVDRQSHCVGRTLA